MTNEKTYQMLWDCKYCGQKKLLGLTHRYCGECGAQQDASARYFPSDEEKVAVEDHFYAGADVQCPNCQAWNGAKAKCCVNCGAPSGEPGQQQKSASLRGDQVRHDEDRFAADSAKAAKEDQARARAPAPPPKRSAARFIVPVAIVAAVVLVIGMFTWKKSGSFEVAGHRWERTIDVEQFGPVRRQDWCDSLPLGARTVGHHSEQRSSRKIPDGENCKVRRKDKGDGTFKEVRECTPKYREEPVMSDKCDYLVDAWKTVRTASAKGASLAEMPGWPKVDLSRPGSCVGCEREGQRSERYVVSLRDDQAKSSECVVDQGKWSSFSDGARYTGKVGVVTGMLDCDSLRAK